MHAAGHTGFVLVASDAVGVGASGQATAQPGVVPLLSQCGTVGTKGQRTERIRTGFAFDTFVLGAHRAVLAHLRHLAYQLQRKDGAVLTQGNLIDTRQVIGAAVLALLVHQDAAVLGPVTHHAPDVLARDHPRLSPAVAERPALVVEMVGDRKSTRLNSSHVRISYAVFC